MTFLFANNATSRLNIDTAGASSTLTVLPGEGAKFPNPTAPDYFVVTIEDRRTNQIEICHCTARSGDILNVTRAQEGTVAQSFLMGATVSNRVTAGTIQAIIDAGYTKDEADNRFINAAGDTMEGPLLLNDDPVEQLEAATRRYVDNAVSSRSPAALATAATLTYRLVAPQSVFDLSVPDLYGNTYTLSQANPETVDLFVGGLRKLQEVGVITGDFIVDALTNTVTYNATLPTNTVVQIDVQTPRNFLAPGAVDVFLLRDIDIAADGVTTGEVDGIRTTFYLAKASDGSPCDVVANEEIAFFIDGVQQIPTIDFTALGSAITFTTAPDPTQGRWGLWFRASA